MSNFITRGFRGRERSPEEATRIPPGQYLVNDFPVLTAGPTPYTPQDKWSFTIEGAVTQGRTWTWDEFLKLPREKIHTDIHCVTRWSKFDTDWEGVSVDTL